MRAVVQRVNEAAVTVAGETVGAIGSGLVVLLGVGDDDSVADGRYLAEKIAHLRVFEDDEGKMNRSLLQEQGEMLIVSQFTLYGDCRKGRRPSFSHAAKPDAAMELYKAFVQSIQDLGIATAEGVFQAHMQVHLVNDGPVTLMLESKGAF